MELSRGSETQPSPDQPEQTREELEVELRQLQVSTDNDYSAIKNDMALVRARVNKLTRDEERMEQIKKILGLPTETGSSET